MTGTDMRRIICLIDMYIDIYVYVYFISDVNAYLTFGHQRYGVDFSFLLFFFLFLFLAYHFWETRSFSQAFREIRYECKHSTDTYTRFNAVHVYT